MATKVKEYNVTKEQLKMNPPDINFCEYCRVFFESDPEVEVSKMNLDLPRSFEITVKELNKFLILSKLLNGVRVIGSARFVVKVSLADRYTVNTTETNAAAIVFRGNKNFVRIIRIHGALTDVDVVVLKPVIVQPHVDNWSNPYGGLETCTYEQLARKVFMKFPQTQFTSAALEKKPAKK